MAYSYDFKDNVVYGADDINAVRASILTRGVVEESNSSCKVVAYESGIKVQEGQAIFADGCRIAVDADGVIKEYTAGEINYVYFLNNRIAGVCEVVVSTAQPEGDYVLLAEIDVEGNISDKRQFAQLKTADTERYAASFTATIQLPNTLTAGEEIGRITLPKSNCSFLKFIFNFANDVYQHIMLFPKEDNFLIGNNENSRFYYGYEQTFTHDYSITRQIRYEVSGDQLILKLVSISSADSYDREIRIAGVCVR